MKYVFDLEKATSASAFLDLFGFITSSVVLTL